MVDERDLVSEKMGIAVGGFRLVCYIALGSGATFPSAPFLHFLGFGWYIAVGSDGPLKDCDPWVCGGLTTPVGICIEGWSGVGSMSWSIILSLSITVSYRSQLSSLFSLSFFVVCDIGPGIGLSPNSRSALHQNRSKKRIPSSPDEVRRGMENRLPHPLRPVRILGNAVRINQCPTNVP